MNITSKYNFGDYIIIKKTSGEIIAAGPIKCFKYNYAHYNTKEDLYCISLDSKHFFSIKSPNIIIEDNPTKIEKELNLYELIPHPWCDVTINPTADVFRDFDDTELDKEVIPLVIALNKIDGVFTTGSCCGHKEKCMWVDFRINNFNSLKNIINVISLKTFENDWFICTNKLYQADTNDEYITLSLKSTRVSDDDIYKSSIKLSEYISTLYC